MKYQKSILKIYETLVKQPLKEFIIEEVIKEAKVGRTSGFNAIKWLENNKLIKIKPIGKQKSINLIINDTSLYFKFFLDSLKIKELATQILFEINLFTYLAYRNVDAISLFGSALQTDKPNDIDLLLIPKPYDSPNPKNIEGINFLINAPMEKLKYIRKRIENISHFPINLHFSTESELYTRLLKLTVYDKSYLRDMLWETDKLFTLKEKYNAVLYDIESIINNINDNSLLPQLIQRLIINLSYCLCWLEDKINLPKKEAINLFMMRYGKKLRNIDKLSNIRRLEVLKKITNEIGQKIFT